MKVGTKSLLFGVHQFLIHPVTVILAWRKLYRRWPNWWQTVAIFCHDLGYWGCSDMDGPSGRAHPYAGADIAGRIVRFFFHDHVDRAVIYWRVRTFTLLHSRELSKQLGVEPSKLCWADKYCVCIEPRWLYLLRARASGEIAEYMRNAKPIGSDLMTLHLLGSPGSAERYWLDWYREKVRNLPEIQKLLHEKPPR